VKVFYHASPHLAQDILSYEWEDLPADHAFRLKRIRKFWCQSSVSRGGGRVPIEFEVDPEKIFQFKVSGIASDEGWRIPADILMSCPRRRIDESQVPNAKTAVRRSSG